MKRFRVSKVGNLGGRLGQMDIGRGKKPTCSPGIWMTTAETGIPNLTPETCKISQASNGYAGLLVTFDNHASSIDVFEKFDRGFLAFSGLEPQPTILTLFDPLFSGKCPGYNTPSGVSTWRDRNQRQIVTPEVYIRGLRSFKTDGFVALHDCYYDRDTKSKAIMKAVDRTSRHVDDCIRLTSNEDVLTILPLGGGYSREMREKDVQNAIKSEKCDGFLLAGFHRNGESSLDVDMDEVESIVAENTIPFLPADAPIFYFGMCDPLMVLRLIRRCRVDFFESSYAHYVSEKGWALAFSNTMDMARSGERQSICVDLNEDRFKNDFSPISDGCPCITCSKYTKAYINHLLATKEMLARILLTIHNLRYFADFFATIREAIAADNFGELFDKIEAESRPSEG